ncbi:MAG: cysteine synthase family protein [Deltaproteobacteria bacterium]|nr:cysteine synthase family protein [Deltaproteobacteria bacterium]
MEAKRRALIERYPHLALIGDTPLLRVDLFADELPDAEVFAKPEWMNPGGSIKDRPELRMLTDAVLDGRLKKEKTIIDSSSGNAGIAYAMIGGMMGYKVHLVVPENASEERKKRIRAHGAQVTFTDAVLGYDEALRHVHRMNESDPDRYFFSDQYANDSNWRAHFDTTAAEILRQTDGKITHFVAGVGTGGTITGVGRRLKEHDKNIRVVCVIPESFPGIEGLKPLENPEDIRPEILDESVIDEKIKVSIDDAYDYCGRFARRGLFLGQSSGAFIKGVHEVAKREKKGRFVTVLSDLGERYFSTRLWD